jgi:hypothetical protein
MAVPLHRHIFPDNIELLAVSLLDSSFLDSSLLDCSFLDSSMSLCDKIR